MHKADTVDYDPILYGADQEPAITAIELETKKGSPDKISIYHRVGGKTSCRKEDFTAYIIVKQDLMEGCDVPHEICSLKGRAPLDRLVTFSSWSDCLKAKDWIARKCGIAHGSPDAPYYFVNDPVHQHMLLTGRTMFKGMVFEDLLRMQVDIECITSEGYEFCNAEREGDKIVAIGMRDSSGWSEVLSAARMSEKEMLERFVELIRQRDPDVIEGHNIFNFDLPYISERAKQNKVRLTIGRDGSTPYRRPSRFMIAERTIAYDRFEIFGRHVVDTLFLVQSYDVSHRSMSGYGLKEAAIHFGVAPKDRTYIEGDQITSVFGKNSKLLEKYVADDVYETGELSRLLSQSNFVQAQILPYSYQNVCVRGNATKIDAMLVREYIRIRHSIPMPMAQKEFSGGYTDIFTQGVVDNVHHCDVRSLYPSLMITRKIAPRTDEAAVFLGLLEELRRIRLDAKGKMKKAASEDQRCYYDALQSAFKILINSFYGYLGFSQGRFCDFDAAEQVTQNGRELLVFMIDWLRKAGAVPVEIDTDGIYYVPPKETVKDARKQEKFSVDFAEALPPGIEIEFDGEYVSMFCYKMKNYALLCDNGEIIIKGAALKSRGLEPFQRNYMSEMLRLKLEHRDAELPKLKQRYAKAIEGREWHISLFAKTETLQDSIATYQAKIKKSSRARSAVYELALASGREYRAGDQISFYVAGTKKTVKVFESAKLVSQWDPNNRDENVAYYTAKLYSLDEKFTADDDAQAELDLE